MDATIYKIKIGKLAKKLKFCNSHKKKMIYSLLWIHVDVLAKTYGNLIVALHFYELTNRLENVF